MPVRPMLGRFKAMTLWYQALQVTPIQLQKYVVVDQLCDKGFSGSNEIWDLKARRRYYPRSVKFVSHSMYITFNIYTHTNYPNKHYT